MTKPHRIMTTIALCLTLHTTIGFAMNEVLIDFTQPLHKHHMMTDATERSAGKSYGAFSFQNGVSRKNSVFFAYLDPQPNGAAFVSLQIDATFNLAPYQTIDLDALSLNPQPTIYQCILHTSTSLSQHFAYTQSFEIGAYQRKVITLPLDDFTATKRGRTLQQAAPLNTKDIQAVGIRIVGRANQNVRQKDLFGLALFNMSAS